MNIKELKKGDRVIANITNDCYKVGDIGTIIEDNKDGLPVIQWDHLKRRTAVWHENIDLLSKNIELNYQIY